MKEPQSSKWKLSIDKQQGLRHVIHAAIRMSLDCEDMFAINMLGQAADKVLLDLLNHQKIEDPMQFEAHIVPERRNEFFRLYREASNFLKHANQDPTGMLTVYDLVEANEILLFANIVRYRRLFSPMTTHMQTYFACITLLHPGLIKWQDMGTIGDEFRQGRRSFEHMTRKEVIGAIKKLCFDNPAFLNERAADLEQVRQSNQIRLSGLPGPPTFRIQPKIAP
jgi:hypothetical protein